MNGLKENINNNNMNRAIITIVIIVSALILSVACDKKTSDKPTTYPVTPHTSVTEVMIDGCEYLYSTATNGVILTHKGNCTNHKNK